tara:strand:- start:892 stop:1083 length:192 start_codon:yes stop_codon:yes gene_type:complete
MKKILLILIYAPLIFACNNKVDNTSLEKNVAIDVLESEEFINHLETPSPSEISPTDLPPSSIH